MTLSLTYTTLKTMLQEWVEDDSAEFASSLDQIIGLGEDRLTLDLDLDFFNQELPGAFISGSPYITRPAGMLAIRSLYYTNASGRRVPLRKRSFDYCVDYWPVSANTGAPIYYSEYTPSQWMVVPTPSAAYAWRARGVVRPEGLSATNPTTFFSTYAGTVLFKACKIEACDFLKMDKAKIKADTEDYASVLLPTAKRELSQMHNIYYGANK